MNQSKNKGGGVRTGELLDNSHPAGRQETNIFLRRPQCLKSGIYFSGIYRYILNVFEIKYLFSAHTGCRGTQNHSPWEFSICSNLFNV